MSHGGETARQRRVLMDVALRLLGRREYARAELREKLVRRHRDKFGASTKKQVAPEDTASAAAEHETAIDPEDLIDTLLDEIAADGLQSDQRYAESLVRRKIRGGYGPAILRRELRAKGIHEALIEQLLRQLETSETEPESLQNGALGLDTSPLGVHTSEAGKFDIGPAPDWHVVATEIVARRYPTAATDPRIWARAMRYLQRRGLPNDAVRAALGRQPREPHRRA